jgi:cation transport ATPase
MLIEWYLRRQLELLNPKKTGRVNSVEALIQLAGLRQLILPTTSFFYTGTPVVRQFFAVQDQTMATKQRVLQLAGSLVVATKEPMLHAIAQTAIESGEPLREIEIDRISELGITGKLDRTWYLLGDEACMQQEQIELGVTIQTLAQQFELDGRYTLFLAQKHPKRLLGIFACEYQIDPAIANVIAGVQNLGLDIVLLTEAKTRIARGVAGRVGISLIHSELNEPDKQRIMLALAKQQPASAILTDGIEAIPSSVPSILVSKQEVPQALAVLSNLATLPVLLESAQHIVQQARKRFFWCKIKS